MTIEEVVAQLLRVANRFPGDGLKAEVEVWVVAGDTMASTREVAVEAVFDTGDVMRRVSALEIDSAGDFPLNGDPTCLGVIVIQDRRGSEPSGGPAPDLDEQLRRLTDDEQG